MSFHCKLIFKFDSHSVACHNDVNADRFELVVLKLNYKMYAYTLTISVDITILDCPMPTAAL